MKGLTKEIDFMSLKNNFEAVCDEMNGSGEAMALTLESGRKVFIVPEKNYGTISRFVITNFSPNRLNL